MTLAWILSKQMSSVVHLHYSLRKNIGTYGRACFEQGIFLVNPTEEFSLKNILHLSKIDLLCGITDDILNFRGHLAKTMIFILH